MSLEQTKLEQISKICRPQTGEDVPLVLFRAFRHFTADYVAQLLGKRATLVFQNGGRELGREAGKLLKQESLDDYLRAVIGFVRDMRMGVLQPRELSDKAIILGLEECLTCAGMDSIGKRICHFETGFVAGIVESFLGNRVRAFESKCNANGEGICEVTVDLTNSMPQE